MVLILKADVPFYLRKGAFYESLDEDDGDQFDVPFDCCKLDLIVECDADLVHLLRSTSFWEVDKVPTQVLSYVFNKGLDKTEIPILPQQYVEMLNAMLAVKSVDPAETITSAILHKLGADMICCLHEREGCVFPPNACAAAAQVNDVETLTYLREQDCPWDATTIDAAIRHNSIECLQFCCSMGCPLSTSSMELAASEGSVHSMEVLHFFGVAYPDHVYFYCRDLTTVQHLRSAGCDWNARNCEVFAQRGMLDCLVFAYEDGCPWNADVCAAAAARGHLNCLEYAHRHGCPWNSSTCSRAAASGHLNCLEYAYLEGCPWNEDTTNRAAENGHLQCFKYAQQRGCAVSPEAMTYALQHSRGWFVLYLVFTGCPCAVLYMYLILVVLNVIAWHTFYTCTPVWGLKEYVHLFGAFQFLMQLLISIYGGNFTHIVPVRIQLVLRGVLFLVNFVGLFCISAVHLVNTLRNIFTDLYSVLSV